MTKKVLSKICSISSLLSVLLFLAGPAHAAPQVDAALAAPTVATGTPFTLSITVSWQGAADQYIIVPPEPELPEGVEKVSSSFASSASADLQHMHYTFLLSAQKNGPYTIKPVAVKYWEKGQDKESTTESAETTFKAVQFTLVGNNAQPVIIICLVVMAGAFAGMVFIVLRRKKARRQKAAAGGAASAGVLAADSLQQCRQCKLRGDYAGFCQAALACARLVAPQDTALAESLTALFEKVQFGSFRPPAEEIERLLRQLEKSSGGLMAEDKKNELDYQKYCK